MNVGERFGKLVCIGKDPERDSRYYLFKCDCGTVKSIISYNVQRGATISCGCYLKGNYPNVHRIHGLAHSRIDNIYKSMVDRCGNPKSYNFYKYGAKGISVCEEWKKNKMSFFKWAFENGYSEKLTIDRIDPKGNYTPSNCRWVDYQTQANNKTNNRLIEIKGETHTLAEWSRISGVCVGTIWRRLHEGWSNEKAVFTSKERR